MFEFHQQRRIDLAASCRDAETIAKVAGAGDVIDVDGVTAQVMHNGVLVEEGCYYGAWMTEIIRRLRGHHEPQEEAAFQLLVDRLLADGCADPVMIELGSFWGYYSLWFARAFPTARLILVEPDPEYLDVGRRNFALNDASATFVPASVGASHGGVSDFLCESDGVRRRVPQISVDGLLADLGCDHADLLLCDAQGAELAMLDGARSALESHRVRFLLVSTHHHTISGDPLTHERCLAALRGAGAQILAEHTVAESFSGDGLIVASTSPDDAGLRPVLSRARPRDSLFGGLETDLADALAERDVARSERDRLDAERQEVLRERDLAVAQSAAARAAAAAAERQAPRVERPRQRHRMLGLRSAVKRLTRSAPERR